MKFFHLVWAGLMRKKLRTVLTFFSIMVAFMLFAFLGSLKAALTGGVQMAGLDRLMLRHKISFIMTLPQAYKARILNVPGVKAVCHQTWFGGVYQDKPENNIGTFPVIPEDFFEMFPEFILKPEEKQAWLNTRTGAIVGRKTANRLGWKLGDRIPLKSSIWGVPAGMSQWEFEIVGIFDGAKKTTDTNNFYFRYDYFEEARQREKGMVGWYSIKISDPARSAEIAAKIDEEFANSPYETKTEAEAAFVQGFANQIGDIGAITMAVVGAVFFTILIVAGNTMGQSVRERTEELGVLKALGFTNSRVLILVLLESCLLAVIAGFSGLGIAWVIVNTVEPPQMLPLVYLPQSTLEAGAIFAVALGVVAGIIPAWQAMRLQIAEALRRGG
ncbi:FtsX-like permease family protein [Haloferula sp. BvORR071]|uniref:ABC transporter permease n=1 Tax=Haloferula sp. BvORR071 TaxID=1396141 RepID=UPI000550E862|nr:FtsX-like permease family protein [Haloferula sp. BvORR071]